MESTAPTPIPPPVVPTSPTEAKQTLARPEAGTQRSQDPYQTPLCAHGDTHKIIAKTMKENPKILVLRRFGSQGFFSTILQNKFGLRCHFAPSHNDAKALNDGEAKGHEEKDTIYSAPLPWLANAIDDPDPERIQALIAQLKDQLKAENYTHLVIEANFEVPDGDLNNLYGICFEAVKALGQEAVDIKLIAPHGGDIIKSWNTACAYYQHFVAPAPTEQPTPAPPNGSAIKNTI